VYRGRQKREILKGNGNSETIADWDVLRRKMILLEDKIANWWDNAELEDMELVIASAIGLPLKSCHKNVDSWNAQFTYWKYIQRSSRSRLGPHIKEIIESAERAQEEAGKGMEVCKEVGNHS
jgi:hypothetical protein